MIIINWNSRQDTLRCLEAVDAQLREVPGSLITVVDNGSTDGSIGAIAARYPKVRLLPLGENRGFTGGLAAALVRSRAASVVFLNNDAIPEPNWLAALVGALDQSPQDTMSIGGRIVDLSGQLIDFIGGAITFDGHAFQSGFRYPLASRSGPSPGDEILFACGGNMISRREPFMKLGGFDDDYFAYLEDVDFGWRSWLSGYRVLYEPGALVRHASSATSQRLGDFERGVLFERNALQTALKNFEVLSEAGGAIFFSFLSRLHHYTSTRNPRAAALTRPPFASTNPSRTGSWLSRIRRKISGRTPLATIDDPLTVMQFRAFHWVAGNADRIAAKRKQVQSQRTRSDQEIFQKFPLHLVPTYPGDDAMLASALFRMLLPELPTVEKNLSDIMRT